MGRSSFALIHAYADGVILVILILSTPTQKFISAFASHQLARPPPIAGYFEPLIVPRW